MPAPKGASSRSEAGKDAKKQPWTTRRLMEWMTGHFEAKSIYSPRVVAEMLLSHVLGCERLRLYMDVERPASELELATLRLLVRRAASHEPVQYLTGQGWFFGHAFEVDRSTLIPRPCTETLVEHVLQWLRVAPGHAEPLIADIGTGTGCIAISLAAQLKAARIIATDVVPEALQLAARNAARHGVTDRIEFREGAGLEPLHETAAEGRFDAICSNPPYVPDHEWDTVPRNVKEHEPASALRGGPDGLNVIRGLIEESGPLLKSGGKLVLEIADCQHDAVIELARKAEYADPQVLKDHEGLWRVLVAGRP